MKNINKSAIITGKMAWIVILFLFNCYMVTTFVIPFYESLMQPLEVKIEQNIYYKHGYGDHEHVFEYKEWASYGSVDKCKYCNTIILNYRDGDPNGNPQLKTKQ